MKSRISGKNIREVAWKSRRILFHILSRRIYHDPPDEVSSSRRDTWWTSCRFGLVFVSYFLAKFCRFPYGKLIFCQKILSFPARSKISRYSGSWYLALKHIHFYFYSSSLQFQVAPAMAHLNLRRYVLYVYTFIRFIEPRLSKLTSHTENKWSSVICEVFTFIFVVWFL